MRSFSKIAGNNKKYASRNPIPLVTATIGCRDSNSANGGLPTTYDWKSTSTWFGWERMKQSWLTDFRIPISSEGQYNKPNTRFKIECFESMVLLLEHLHVPAFGFGLSINVNVYVYIHIYICMSVYVNKNIYALIHGSFLHCHVWLRSRCAFNVGFTVQTWASKHLGTSHQDHPIQPHKRMFWKSRVAMNFHHTFTCFCLFVSFANKIKNKSQLTDSIDSMPHQLLGAKFYSWPSRLR